jgi:hypothetical protein
MRYNKYNYRNMVHINIKNNKIIRVSHKNKVKIVTVKKINQYQQYLNKSINTSR